MVVVAVASAEETATGVSLTTSGLIDRKFQCTVGHILA